MPRVGFNLTIEWIYICTLLSNYCTVQMEFFTLRINLCYLRVRYNISIIWISEALWIALHITYMVKLPSCIAKDVAYVPTMLKRKW